MSCILVNVQIFAGVLMTGQDGGGACGEDSSFEAGFTEEQELGSKMLRPK